MIFATDLSNVSGMAFHQLLMRFSFISWYNISCGFAKRHRRASQQTLKIRDKAKRSSGLCKVYECGRFEVNRGFEMIKMGHGGCRFLPRCRSTKTKMFVEVMCVLVCDNRPPTPPTDVCEIATLHVPYHDNTRACTCACRPGEENRKM